MTPQAQNEILKLLSLKLLCEIAADICSSGSYSILADEATDVSSIQQLVICIRWVTKHLVIEEDFIGLMPLDKANTTNILTHCYCHALNLAVGDTVKSVPLLKEALEDAYELTKLVKYSPKRQATLKNIQEELKIENLNLPVDNANADMESFSRLRLFCPTRWTVRAKALHSISNNYRSILEMLGWCNESQNTSDSDIRARAGGLEKKRIILILYMDCIFQCWS